jgi:hypothetical protein
LSLGALSAAANERQPLRPLPAAFEQLAADPPNSDSEGGTYHHRAPEFAGAVLPFAFTKCDFETDAQVEAHLGSIDT